LNMPDARYWETKIRNYLHDPPFKALSIQEHERLAGRILEAFQLATGADQSQVADWYAASADRAVLPSHQQGGSVDFRDGGITHPLGGDALRPPSLAGLSADDLADRVATLVRDDLRHLRLEQLSPADAARRKYLYLDLALRQCLAVCEPALGGLWYRLPADTRMPDHSIWQHCALTAALASCKDPQGGIAPALLVWGIAPVQDYIEKARKARDLWTGSVILSHLMFAGLKWVMHELGPDHVLYPSLVDQPLVAEHLKRSHGIPEQWLETGSLQCPSFPNKAVALVPAGQEQAIAENIERAIKESWADIWQSVHEAVIHRVAVHDPQGFWQLWTRQCESYWQITWASFPLIDKDHEAEAQLREWFSGSEVTRYCGVMEKFHEINQSQVHPQGLLYGLAHQGVQGVYAAAKLVRRRDGRQEPGEKCIQCAEFQQLHDPGIGDDREATRAFWKKIALAWGDDETLFRRAEKERLCALCLTKRLASLVFKRRCDHLLSAVFHRADSFKSTSALAGVDREEEDKPESADEERLPYYAILLMDGDEMGKIVAGAPCGFTWQEVLAPPLVKRITGADGEALRDQTVAGIWRRLLPKERLLTPARHAAISEALGYFSTVTVPQVIEQHEGELIYAGGDDVLALLPVRSVVKAARELAHAYQWSYVSLAPDPARHGHLKAESLAYVSDKPGRLVIHMGPKATISAGIAIVHHKAPFKWALREAHRLLDDIAKKRCGRGAFAIGLYKRGGGPAIFGAKWDSGLLNILDDVADALEKGGQDLSRGLAYHVEALEPGLKPLTEEQGPALERMLERLLDKSGLSGGEQKEKREELAASVARLLCPQTNVHRGDRWTDPLLIARFLGEVLAKQRKEHADAVV
jgi:CRISPR-associated protein Cmr2